MAWLIGMTPPSATPINRRAASSMPKVPAMPVMKEQAEKSRVATTNGSLRLPSASDSPPIAKAAIAQVKESALARLPICVLVRCSSGCTNGIRKFSELRSKKTMPKLRLSKATSTIWYPVLLLVLRPAAASIPDINLNPSARPALLAFPGSPAGYQSTRPDPSDPTAGKSIW